MMTWQLEALKPLLRWAYRDAAPGFLFPLTRVASCAGAVLLPAIALGATFPMGIRWFAGSASHPGRVGGSFTPRTPSALHSVHRRPAFC